MAVINIETALDRFDGDVDIYLEIAEAFLESGMTDSGGIAESLSSGDAKKALYFAHKIKGAALTVGADALAETAGKLEAALRSEKVADCSGLASSVERETAIALGEMKGLVRKLSTRS